MQIPGSTASSGQWIAFHKEMLKQGVAKSRANQLFMDAFTQYSSCDANNNELRNYAKSQGFTVTACYGIGSDIYDSAADTLGAVDSGFASIGTFAFVGVLIVVVLGGFMVYQLFKD